MAVQMMIPPVNQAFTQLGFLPLADFMICTMNDLNSLGFISNTWAQKNHTMKLHHFWADQPLKTRDWMTVTADIYEARLASPMATPMTKMTSPLLISCNQFANAITCGMPVGP